MNTHLNANTTTVVDLTKYKDESVVAEWLIALARVHNAPCVRHRHSVRVFINNGDAAQRELREALEKNGAHSYGA